MYSRIYADKPRLSKQEKQYVRDAKVLALAGLEMVDQKHNKLANLLNINKEMLDNILNERENKICYRAGNRNWDTLKGRFVL